VNQRRLPQITVVKSQLHSKPPFTKGRTDSARLRYRLVSLQMESVKQNRTIVENSVHLLGTLNA
jgi:hypothetical protein